MQKRELVIAECELNGILEDVLRASAYHFGIPAAGMLADVMIRRLNMIRDQLAAVRRPKKTSASGARRARAGSRAGKRPV